MIRLKEMKLKGGNSAGLAGPGVTSITDKDADMFFFPVEEYVVARRKKNKEEFLIPTADIAFMKSSSPHEVFIELDEQAESDRLDEEELAAQTKANAPRNDYQISEVAPAPVRPPDTSPDPVALGDTARMVKIGGKIVERKGPMQNDELEARGLPFVAEPEPTEAELEALTAPAKRGIFADVAEAEEEPTDDSHQ